MNANDMEKTIEIPEGYEARIEGNKIILELKKSEDERVRKELLEVIKHCYEDGGYALCTDDYRKYSAYLERQKGIVMHTPRYAPPEQKPVQDKEEREYVRTLKSLIADFLRDKDEIDRGYYQKIYDWLDGRHIEQKLVNDRYMDGYVKGYADGLKNAEDSYNRGVSYHFDNPNIQRLDPNVVIESKTGGTYPDILEGTLTGGKSIEDKDAIELPPKQDYSGLTDLERAIHRGFLCAGVENVPVGIIKDTAQDCLAHIKPAEWSEEDEIRLKEAIEVLDESIKYLPMGYGFSKDVRLVKDWLKSLHPQPKSGWDKTDKAQLLQIIEDGVTKSLCKKGFHFHFNEEYAKDLIEYICSFNLSKSNWKPSEEQMEALQVVIEHGLAAPNREASLAEAHIESLYEDLQKL